MKFRFTPDKGKDIEFTQDDEADFDIACQKVCNMLDEPQWKWLADKINADKLTWYQIMNEVAAHI